MVPDLKQCCAIDYILHTVDSATALLNSPRAFPSRYVFSRLLIHLFAVLTRSGLRFLNRSGFQSRQHHTGTSLLSPVVLAEFLLMPIFTIAKHLSKPKPNHRFMLASSNSLINLIWSPQNFSSFLKAPSITMTRATPRKSSPLVYSPPQSIPRRVFKVTQLRQIWYPTAVSFRTVTQGRWTPPINLG